MEKVLVKAVFKQNVGVFEVEIDVNNVSPIKLVLTSDQFLALAKYLAQIGDSYIKSIRNLSSGD